MNAIVKKLFKFFGPKNLRDYAKLYLLLKERDVSPRLVECPEGRKVIVLAPHMDDEIIGCGGTLRKHAQAGAEVTVVYVTDGRRGNPAWDKEGLPSDKRRKHEDELVQIRKEEARRAAKIIGIKELLFLDYPDAGLRTNEERSSELAKILAHRNPDVVYLPFLTDQHPDHWQTNRLFAEAIKNKTLAFDCYGYEVWSHLYPNCIVDITATMEVKKRALEQFQSQLKHCDYIRAVVGLNTYRSLDHVNGGFAEAFFRCSIKEYLYLYEKMCV